MEKNNKNNKLTFAERARKIKKSFPRASWDPIEARDMEQELEALMQEQESVRESMGMNQQEQQQQIPQQQFDEGGNIPDSLYTSYGFRPVIPPFTQDIAGASLSMQPQVNTATNPVVSSPVEQQYKSYGQMPNFGNYSLPNQRPSYITPGQPSPNMDSRSVNHPEAGWPTGFPKNQTTEGVTSKVPVVNPKNATSTPVDIINSLQGNTRDPLLTDVTKMGMRGVTGDRVYTRPGEDMGARVGGAFASGLVNPELGIGKPVSQKLETDKLKSWGTGQKSLGESMQNSSEDTWWDKNKQYAPYALARLWINNGLDGPEFPRVSDVLVDAVQSHCKSKGTRFIAVHPLERMRNILKTHHGFQEKIILKI